jgi:hypothetical protein
MDNKSTKLVELAREYAELRSDPQRNSAILSATARQLSDLLIDLELERYRSTHGSSHVELAHSFLSC